MINIDDTCHFFHKIDLVTNRCSAASGEALLQMERSITSEKRADPSTCHVMTRCMHGSANACILDFLASKTKNRADKKQENFHLPEGIYDGDPSLLLLRELDDEKTRTWLKEKLLGYSRCGGRRALSVDQQIEAVRMYLSGKQKVTEICLKMKVSCPTLYKYVRRLSEELLKKPIQHNSVKYNIYERTDIPSPSTNSLFFRLLPNGDDSYAINNLQVPKLEHEGDLIYPSWRHTNGTKKQLLSWQAGPETINSSALVCESGQTIGLQNTDELADVLEVESNRDFCLDIDERKCLNTPPLVFQDNDDQQ